MSTEAIRKKLLVRFREVTADRVERLLAALTAIGTDGDAAARQELMRELHTLKGEARMMGFAGLSSLAHEVEDRVQGLEGPEQAAPLLRVCEAMPGLLEYGAEDPAGKARLDELLAILKPAFVPALEGTPASSPGASSPQDVSVFGAPPEGAGPAPPPPGAPQPSSIRVDLDSLDSIAGLVGDVIVEGAKARMRAHELRELLESWPLLAQRLLAFAERRHRDERQPLPEAEVDAAALEYHRLRTRTFRFFHYHSESLDGTRQIISTLADEVADARLLPLEGVFSGLQEAASQLAADYGKEVECIVTNGEIGVDRAILPSLSDPLIHLLRNCVYHGLELPGERLAAGKPAKGRLRISARTDGDHLQVRVKDDGRGIDVGLIRSAALRRGLIDELAAAQLPDREVIDLIFAPGFSTLETGDEVSGRGVGLDVVRGRVVSLGGTVEVETERGVGTTFTLTLPQSLSLMKVLLLQLDEDIYGVPAAAVELVQRIDPQEVREVAGIRTLQHQGRIVPIVPLGPLLALNGGPSGQRPHAALLRVGERCVALAVDGIFGQREVAVKAPSAFLKGMRFVSGAAALEDGRIALLLSTAELMEAARAFGAPTASSLRRRLRVLLVDDSLIAREAEAALLRGLGHEVSEAADGEEGWQKLLAGTFDLLVTDVQMPILDGIELTKRVKAEERLRKMPVVIVSSLSSPRDRRRGSEAGADAFLGKADLDGAALGETIERLCGVGV